MEVGLFLYLKFDFIMGNLIGKLKKLKIKQQQQQQKILLQLCMPVSQKIHLVFSNHLLQSIIDFFFPLPFIVCFSSLEEIAQEICGIFHKVQVLAY